MVSQSAGKYRVQIGKKGLKIRIKGRILGEMHWRGKNITYGREKKTWIRKNENLPNTLMGEIIIAGDNIYLYLHR